MPSMTLRICDRCAARVEHSGRDAPEGWDTGWGVYCPECWGKLMILGDRVLKMFREQDRGCSMDPGTWHGLIEHVIREHWAKEKKEASDGCV